MQKISIKYLKFAQRARGAGWSKHVSPWLRKKANKKLRKLLKQDFDSSSNK